MFFISGAEIIFIFFIVLLVFGADKIPSLARGLAKTMTQVRRATNDIKSEIQKSSELNDPSNSIIEDLKDEVDQVKEGFDEVSDSIKRNI
ncbi:MAG: twin-arginine translocase TatA/TatE family subunit [Flavobacteriaceae bacterium]|nr:twin-arginine translocase TatA/TatE family subunit [Flavobacteriaceae bacterium]|tara:strand:+ start:803 stop:1072 length:270 start_codon:yes stop_codon:yes gene_type:complete